MRSHRQDPGLGHEGSDRGDGGRTARETERCVSQKAREESLEKLGNGVDSYQKV